MTNYEFYDSQKFDSAIPNQKPDEIAVAVKKRVRRVLWERVGIARDAQNLKRALHEFEQIERANLGTASRNFVLVAKLIAKAALWREESRGGHFRTDFPDSSAEFLVHSIQKLGSEITASRTINF